MTNQVKPCATRVVHLPVYPENAYQPLLMQALRSYGISAIDGGGGGDFLRTALFRWKADILHFHWLHPYVLRQGTLSSIVRATRFLAEITALKLAGCRIVWTVHNLSNHGRHLPKLERFFSIQFARQVDGMIVHSQAALAAANKAFRVRPRTFNAVIPQGSYADCYPNGMSKAACRKELGLEPEAFVFVFLGRIEPYKGTLDLIRAFKHLEETAHLIIAGRVSGARMSKVLQDSIGGLRNIHLHEGFVSEDRLQLFLNAADIYVYPVRDILNSGSIPLAMSFGLPCIAPAIGGVPEVLGKNGGILYNPDHPGGLVGAMQQALVRRGELGQIGLANLARAKQWTWDQVAEHTLGLYKQCLSR